MVSLFCEPPRLIQHTSLGLWPVRNLTSPSVLFLISIQSKKWSQKIYSLILSCPEKQCVRNCWQLANCIHQNQPQDNIQEQKGQQQSIYVLRIQWLGKIRSQSIPKSIHNKAIQSNTANHFTSPTALPLPLSFLTHHLSGTFSRHISKLSWFPSNHGQSTITYRWSLLIIKPMCWPALYTDVLNYMLC